MLNKELDSFDILFYIYFIFEWVELTNIGINDIEVLQYLGAGNAQEKMNNHICFNAQQVMVFSYIKFLST